MNDPEVIMPVPSNGLAVYRKALVAAGRAMPLVRRLPWPYRSLASQIVAAAASVPANLAEGHARTGGDRTYHWRVAYGSAREVDSHLRLLVVAGAIDAEHVGTVLELFDEVRAMTWRLLHPTR